MKALKHRDDPEVLLSESRQRSGRIVHRLLAIRDLMLKRRRKWVCEQYGISRENLRHWVEWYNDYGIDGLEDAERCGRPTRLTKAQKEALKARVSVPPNLETDGIGRWRAEDVQRLIKQEYGVEYKSLTSIYDLLHNPSSELTLLKYQEYYV